MKRYLAVFLLIWHVGCDSDKFDSEVTLPKLFEDGMVLQRDQKISVWGKGVPNEKVRVSIAGLLGSTEVNADSTWSIKLPASNAGGPYVLQVNHSQVKDVYIGDVWIAGGQSNMEWALKSAVIGAEQEIAEGGLPKIRFFKVPKEYSATPQNDLDGGKWEVATPENMPNFSAVAWFFAKRNHLEKKVPVGIIESNWGGTPAEGWTELSVLAGMNASYSKEAQDILENQAKWQDEVIANEERRALRDQLVPKPDSLKALQVAGIGYDDSQWRKINLPQSNPLQHIAWVRKVFKAKSSESATLHLPMIDQMGYVYLNGKLLHYKDWGTTTPDLEIPSSSILEGNNVLTIRAINTWNNQPRIGEPDEMYLIQGGNKISLEGNWAYSNDKVEPQLPKVDFLNWKPGMMFNAMINPLVNFPIKGAIWYQGESNAGKAGEYHALFSAMITNWRTRWGLGDFPFLFVQLANFMDRKSPQPDSEWAFLRDAQKETLGLPNTGMAVIIDIGEAGDIHPKNKKDVGERLWLQAKKVAYGEELVSSGPVLESATLNPETIVLNFSEVGEGLATIDDSELVKGFIIGDARGRFQEANAMISGKNEITIEIGNSDISEVRYAWADNPEVNLVNHLNLPAGPFKYSFEKE